MSNKRLLFWKDRSILENYNKQDPQMLDRRMKHIGEKCQALMMEIRRWVNANK